MTEKRCTIKWTDTAGNKLSRTQVLKRLGTVYFGVGRRLACSQGSVTMYDKQGQQVTGRKVGG